MSEAARRTTRQQRAVEEVLRRAGRPLTAFELLEGARGEVGTLGLATVYRAIRRMVEAGEATAVELPGEAARYEARELSSVHHHFFKCGDCDRVFSVAACPGNMQSLAPEGFEVEAHEIVLYGRCRECVPGGGRRGGFTLVELLVTIAVIGVLAGVLLPSIGSARRAAEVVECAHNMRQLAFAQVAFALENDGALVDYGLSHGPLNLGEEFSWIFQLRPFTDDALVLRSGLDDSPHWGARDGGAGEPIPKSTSGRPRLTSYGLNEHVTSRPPVDPLTGRRRGVDDLDLVPSPAETIQWVFIAERGEFAGSDHVHPSSWGDPRFKGLVAVKAATQMGLDAVSGPVSVFDGTQYLRASDAARSNYAYLDGHVETQAFSEVYESTSENRFNPLLR